MKRTGLIALSLWVTAGCGGTDVGDFEGYGVGMPGSGLTEGGEVLMEKFFVSDGLTPDGVGNIAINTFYAFAYNGDFTGATMAPAPGTCFEFQHPVSFPVHDIPATADYVDWGANIHLAGPGVDLDIPKVVAPAAGLVDNRPSPVRTHKEGSWIYGGPSWQGDNFQSFDIEGGAEYTLTMNDNDVTFNFAREWDFPLSIGTAEVEVPSTAPEGGWEITWTQMMNPETPHSRQHDFVFVAFAQFPDAAAGDLGPTPLYICQPPDTEDGSLIVSQEVLDNIPDAGIIQSGRLTHWMEDGELVGNPDRRLDVFAIWCAVSSYSKTP